MADNNSQNPPAEEGTSDNNGSPTPVDPALQQAAAQPAVKSASNGRIQVPKENIKPPFQGVLIANEDMKTWLYQSHGSLYDDNIVKLEVASGMKREQIAYAAFGLYALILIVMSPAEFFCNIVSFLYPAFASVKAVRSVDTDDDTHWLIYWTVFATFSLLDFFLGLVPFYFMFKAFFLMYLYLPQTDGSKFVYYRCVDPLFDMITGTKKTE